MEPEKWTHTIHRNGIILWSWNYHIMESYQGDGIIPWDHTMAMESYHGITMESYQGHGIILWDHTMVMESYHGIIQRAWNYAKTESYHTVHRHFLTTFIYQDKPIQNNNM
jgi:hypothetical protein